MSLKKAGPSARRLSEDAVGGRPLLERYSRADLAVFTDAERRHLQIDSQADPRRESSLAWQLLYRFEPETYDRLVSAERLNPGILDWLPRHVERIIEVAAGTGRLTLELVTRCHRLTAIEPAAPMRALLERKLDERQPTAAAVQVMSGFFDALPVADRSAELVIACSALTPEPSQGGDRGLAEMERACTAGGMVVIVWPNHPDWLSRHGYRYREFPGQMAMEFASLDEAIELGRIFYPNAVDEIRRRGDRRVPYELLGVNPPRDLAYKMMV